MDEHSLRVLEFEKVLARLADHTSFSAGRELALNLRPATNRDEVVRRQRMTAEARRLYELQPRVGLGGVHDVRALADKAGLGAALQPSELLDVASTLGAAGNLRSTILRFRPDEKQQGRDELPLLSELASEMEPLPELVAEINRSIDQRAEVTDAASPALASLRRNVRIAHDRLNNKLQDFLNSDKYRDAIQEPIITLRDGRYVIPVKADQRGQIKGIVHDVSSSGATVFLEPLPVVELGNTWRELQLEEEREVERVLRELSAMTGDGAEAIIDTVGVLAELDLAFAKGHLGLSFGGTELPHEGDEQPWIVEPGGSLHIVNGRHPLLTLKIGSGEDGVVPMTATVGDEHTALLLTGPNTGGKTVALKTAGLLAVMAQSGLPVPADAASTMPVFDDIHADIGDEQSIEQSLSTFSSHMTNIINVLERARPESLVLLDELAAGTDPIEGSALARAILIRLLEIGCLVIATTHHGELKAFAHSTEGITNASVEFDPVTLAPTYHLTIGLPGRSNALTIAERLGLPHDLIELARSAIDPDQAQVETLLTDIRRERDEAATAREAEVRARGEAEQAKQQAEERLAEVEERLDEMVERSTAELEADIESVRRLVTQAEAAAERGRAKRAAERLEKALERKKQTEEKRPQRSKKPKTSPRAPADGGGPAPKDIQPGDLVWIEGYDRYGEAISPPDDRGEIELHLGPLRGRIRLDQVERVQRPKHGEGRGSRVEGQGVTTSLSDVEPPPLELEIRGQTVDEAIPTVDQYLDQAYRAALPFVRIIHGRGTGTLRAQVRELLAKHPLVKSYETGKREEGGEGVTVVHLAE